MNTGLTLQLNVSIEYLDWLESQSIMSNRDIYNRSATELLK